MKLLKFHLPPSFVEFKSSWPCSQESATGPYPEQRHSYVHLRFSRRWLWRMVSSGMLCHVALVRTDVPEELSASETLVLTRATRHNIQKDTVRSSETLGWTSICIFSRELRTDITSDLMQHYVVSVYCKIWVLRQETPSVWYFFAAYVGC
jgi:hypothetical protein